MATSAPCISQSNWIAKTSDRWIAEVSDLPAVLAYGQTRNEALARAEALALRYLADRLEHGESGRIW